MARDEPDGWSLYAKRDTGQRHLLRITVHGGRNQLVYSCRCGRWTPRRPDLPAPLVEHEWFLHYLKATS